MSVQDADFEVVIKEGAGYGAGWGLEGFVVDTGGWQGNEEGDKGDELHGRGMEVVVNEGWTAIRFIFRRVSYQLWCVLYLFAPLTTS